MKQALTPFFFYAFAAVSVIPGIFVLASRDIVRASFWLLAALSGFAGLYVLLGADFLAVTQVVVYLGGILILILFGVMLTHRDPALARKARRLNIVVPGIAGGATLTAAVAAAMTRAHFGVLTVAISSIAPANGSLEGGTRLKIEGTNLASVTTVKIGSVPAKIEEPPVGVERSATEIVALTPPHAEGAATLTLESSAGTLTAPDAFHYVTEPEASSKASVQASSKPTLTGRTTHDVGVLLVAEDEHGKSYLLPFEIASVLLLAALVGAAYLARRGGDPLGGEGSAFAQENSVHG